MPLYDFECLECKHTFEESIPVGDSFPRCPDCKNERVQKLLSPPPVIFKGEGFYTTDSETASKPKNTAHAPENKSTSQEKKESDPKKKSETPKETTG